MNPSSIKGASFWGSWPLLILKTPKPQAHRFFLGSNRLLRRHLLFLRLRKKVTKRQGIHNSEVRSSWAPGVPNLPSLDICQKKSDSNIDLSGASRCCQGEVSHCFAVFSPPENPAHKKNDLNLQRVSGYRESTFTDLKPVEGSQVAKDQRIKSSGFPSYSIHKERKTAAYLSILSRLWAPFLSRSFLGVFDPRYIFFSHLGKQPSFFPHQAAPLLLLEKKIQPLSFVTPGIHPQLREVVVPSPSFFFLP